MKSRQSSPAQPLHKISLLLLIVGVIFLYCGCNGVYNMYMLSRGSATVGGYTFAAPALKRSLLYFWISGVSCVLSLLCSAISYMKVKNAQR